MKKSTKGLLMILGIASATTLAAQNVSDPTYSIHNYKHPNKAAKMKAIQDAKPDMYVEEIKPDKVRTENNLTASSNYKAMSAEKNSTREFRVSDAPEAVPFFIGAPNANYKQQFPSRTRKIDVPEEKPEPSIVAADMAE